MSIALNVSHNGALCNCVLYSLYIHDSDNVLLHIILKQHFCLPGG